MVYPSRGCVTCKKRHLKCDSTRPTCNLCRKSSKNCRWESDETSLSFRSENVFAQGQRRRPPRQPAIKGRQRPAPVATPPFSIAPLLSVPVKLQAFNYWIANLTACPSDLPDIGHDYSAYVLCHWNRAQPDSSLHLAVSAYSLAAFGRKSRMFKTLEIADNFYAQSIVKTQHEIKEPSNESIHQLLLVTILLTNYENILYGVKQQSVEAQSAMADKIGSRVWANMCHLKGTEALLQFRQQKKLSSNVALERAVRRPLLRAYILRGISVPEWLQDGAIFGEEGSMLRLDLLMVRAANLRSKMLSILRDTAPSTNRIKDITLEAVNLDADLAAWPQNIPEEWSFSIHSVKGSNLVESDFLDENSVHIYTTVSHATIWNQYRAVRIIANSIYMQLLCLTYSTPHEFVKAQLEACRENIASLAADVCDSLPFFFYAFTSIKPSSALDLTKIENVITYTKREIGPMIANFTAWSLTVAVSTEPVPDVQKQWLRQKLRTIASIAGNGVLESVVERGEFQF